MKEVLGSLPESTRMRVAPALVWWGGELWTSIADAETNEIESTLLPQLLEWHPHSSVDLRRLRIALPIN